MSSATVENPAEPEKEVSNIDEQQLNNSPICRYYVRGICRFGSVCRFSHNVSETEIGKNNSDGVAQQVLPSTSKNINRKNWIDAPIFVPNYKKSNAVPPHGQSSVAGMDATPSKSWSEVVGGDGNKKSIMQREMEMMCPFESPCPYGAYCQYNLHFELCKMCDHYCLHPTDLGQRRKHNRDCLQQHEQAMELSFAIARSKDKTCGICFETVMEKTGREKRFGILPNCCHIFCLECIRKWRQAKQFEHKITRSCPECRTSSDFVCPSAFWVDTKEEKEKLLTGYRSALGAKDCKYFKKGAGECPFGNKCFYKHALPNGDKIDVGCPKRSRKLHRGTNEIMDLIDIYLWEYFNQRDYNWLEMVLSDNSEDSDWSDDNDGVGH